MSGFEKYVGQAAEALARSTAHVAPTTHPWEGMSKSAKDRNEIHAAAVLEAVGPLIAEDTRERMVAAAGRAVEREGCEDAADKARREYAAMDDRHLNSCIWIDPGRQVGVACFGGTRVPVDPFMAIVEEAGEDAARALWPSVTEAHVAAGKMWRSRYHEWLRGAR